MPLSLFEHTFSLLPDSHRVVAVRGTLVVVVPTADGILIAADSRGTAAGRFIDHLQKIEVAPTRRPIVFALTGLTEFLSPCPNHLTLDQWISESRFSFRASDVVNSLFSSTPNFILSLDTFTELAQSLANQYQHYLMSDRRLRTTLVGKSLCRLAMCQIRPDDSTPVYASASIDCRPDGAAPRDFIVNTYLHTDPLEVILLGSGRYVIDHVLNGVGRPFLSDEALTLYEGDFRIQDVTPDQVDRLAVSIIEATKTTTAYVPTPDGIGIGGPVQRAFLTSSQVTFHSPRAPG
jgi:hypothetical protein